MNNIMWKKKLSVFINKINKVKKHYAVKHFLTKNV